MVAIIKTGYSINRIFYYNENKVKDGIASCIGAGNYPIDIDQMSETIKLNRLLKQAALNENVKRNSVHVSLNFDISDTNLTQEKLMKIANTYMRKINFGNQPYLVYQHFDAGHPHIHIVSLKVRENGTRINTQFIGRDQSQIARKEIEQEFGLIKADSRKIRESPKLTPPDLRKVEYGRSETRKAISNVLDVILLKYNYTSLPELNAVLKQYNVLADRGSENSNIYKNKGLIYRILDEYGSPIGVPIKASSFYNRPTLAYLEKQFNINKTKRQKHKSRIQNEIDRLLVGKSISFKELIKNLQKKGIHVERHQSNEGRTYGLTFIDHHAKCVFNGRNLGPKYSAKSLQERCHEENIIGPQLQQKTIQEQPFSLQSKTAPITVEKSTKNITEAAVNTGSLGSTLQMLTESEIVNQFIPYQLKRKRKKKKKKNLQNNQ